MRVQVRDFVTGFFVIAGVGAFIFLTMKVKDGVGGETDDFIAYFDDVMLLEEGSSVALGGVEVGRVNSIAPKEVGENEFKIAVEFTVTSKIAARLRKGTTVSVGQKSLLGSKFVMVRPSFAGDVLEKDGGMTLVEGAIGPGMFGDIIDAAMLSLKPTLDRVHELLDNVNNNVLAKERMDQLFKLLRTTDESLELLNKNFLADDKAQDILALLNSARTSLDQINEHFLTEARADELFELVMTLRATLENVNQNVLSEENTASISDLLKNANMTLDKVHNEVLSPANLARIENLLDSTNDTLVEARGTLRRVQADGGTIDRLDNLLASTNDVMTDPKIHTALYELQLTLQEFRLLARSLRGNPAQIIFGGPGEEELKVQVQKDQSRQYLDGRARRYD